MILLIMSESSGVYYHRLERNRFEATPLTEGAWNEGEQHMAPVAGLLVHLLEEDHRERGGSLQLASISCDILGVIPDGVFDVELRVLRPGRTIELSEATLISGGRAAVRARAWMLQRSDTAELEGTSFPEMPPIDETPPLAFGELWRGACVRTVEVRRSLISLGRAKSWLRSRARLLEDAEISVTARLASMLDFANGVSPRASSTELAFPNIDLNASFFRSPRGDWLGLDTTVSFGPSGLGVTESILHDEKGAFGTLSQTLTVRPFG